MTDPNDANIPEEILRSERQQAAPVRPTPPGSLGLPGLPPDILGVLVHYGPMLVLAASAFGAFNAITSFALLSSASPALNSSLPLATFLSLAASVGFGLAYMWLTQKRRLGWNALAFALIIQFFSQFLLTGVGSILSAGVELLISAYLMLQIRDSFSK